MAKGGNASTTLTGSPETFQHDLIGTFTDSSFPTGWSDTAQVTSHSTAPQPSAVVIETADAFGHPTKALATLPNVALSQGIYRPIEPSDFYTANVVVNIDLGVQVEEGKWYSVETDFNASNGALHGQVIDATTGLTLADKMVFVTDPKYAFAGGTYDPSVDGVFNTEAYNDGEVSLSHTSDPDLNKPGLAVIDNIDTSPQHPGIAFDHAIKVWDSMCSDHG